MLIKRIDATHAQLDIESLQGNGHECTVSGIAELKGSKLTYVQRDEHDEDDGRGFTIDGQGAALKIQYIPDPETQDNNAFCAINASLEAIAFKKTDRQPAAAQTCGR